MKLFTLLKVMTPVEHVKVVEYADDKGSKLNIIYSNLYPHEILKYARENQIDLDVYEVKCVSSMMDFDRHYTYIQVIIRDLREVTRF